MARRDEGLRLKRKLPRAVVLISAVLTVGGCAVAPNGVAPAPARADVLWLNRVTYGVNSATLAEYERRGRTAFLDQQLENRDPLLPTVVAGGTKCLVFGRAGGEQPVPPTTI